MPNVFNAKMDIKNSEVKFDDGTTLVHDHCWNHFQFI